jgi:hypothetical protein
MINDSFDGIRNKINKFLDSNENEDTTYQNLWDTAKGSL